MNDVIEFLKTQLTPAELRAAIFLLLFIYSVTELLKRAHRRIYKRFNIEDAWFISTASGLVGAWFIWPPASRTPFWIAGLILAFLASFAYRWILIGIKWRAPELAAIISGDRRKRSKPPPDGIERRE